ncbi:MAG TPA: TIGR04255 family protein [Candidatus Angelobacter sp.]|jgi:uncharacterized protein (TIGR04255 family)|nr:TIGR04255 family protein [Candidatus Angelobacter sp.]
MISEKDLNEIFPHPAVREVACEIRFAPRLRIVPDIWRVQDKVASSYPQVGEEETRVGDSKPLRTFVFANPTEQRLIKVSQENFVFVTLQYRSYEELKAEALKRIDDFCQEFEINSLQRIGLRYVNHIELGKKDGITALQKYVNAPVKFDEFELKQLEQFLTEFRIAIGHHKLTIRGALLQLPTDLNRLLYVLDLDCFTLGANLPAALDKLLDEFHYAIQLQFLKHVREEYKQLMRQEAP